MSTGLAPEQCGAQESSLSNEGEMPDRLRHQWKGGMGMVTIGLTSSWFDHRGRKFKGREVWKVRGLGLNGRTMIVLQNPWKASSEMPWREMGALSLMIAPTPVDTISLYASLPQGVPWDLDSSLSHVVHKVAQRGGCLRDGAQV